ncbi:uncharacterized protein LOC111390638 isoform X2 [Olea europaea var. sylvestris]|uniref:uncharacterized protein LOC111390638 isoform X2 n=1 Tax=Olea europaea var. sylvestris TaxID=158386 RepID=UPI000C1D1CE6|nr:uncharacterized protein LOC111390638 isoform X2 [Olea europaea var. sylvestris]
MQVFGSLKTHLYFTEDNVKTNKVMLRVLIQLLVQMTVLLLFHLMRELYKEPTGDAESQGKSSVWKNLKSLGNNIIVGWRTLLTSSREDHWRLEVLLSSIEEADGWFYSLLSL